MAIDPKTEYAATYFTSEDKEALRAFADRNRITLAEALRLGAHLFIKHPADTAQTVLRHARELSVQTTPLPPQAQRYSPLEPLPRASHNANKVGDQ